MTNEEAVKLAQDQMNEIATNATAILEENKRLRDENEALKANGSQSTKEKAEDKEKIKQTIENWGKGKSTSKTNSAIEAWAKSRQ